MVYLLLDLVLSKRVSDVGRALLLGLVFADLMNLHSAIAVGFHVVSLPHLAESSFPKHVQQLVLVMLPHARKSTPPRCLLGMEGLGLLPVHHAVRVKLLLTLFERPF